ncbi:MAG: radical SAM protein [Elusimicrobia bacterium]|nr:radical SAM protein [Elusimicrobiota bacterium]
MTPSASPYKKHNSFVEIRQKKPLSDARARIEKVLADASDMGLGQDAADLVRQACRELLGKAAAPKPYPAFKLHANVIEELDRLEDSELPRYLHYRYRYEVFPDRKLLDAYPPCVQIEPTSVCNFRCVFCYQTDAAFTTKKNGFMGMMSLDLFKRIVDLLEGHVEAVSLASRGEPFVCPDIGKMLAYASGKFLALKLNTNASLLDEAKCHAILESGVATLVFSADAAEEPKYSELRVGGSLEKTLKNVRLFHDVKEKHYPDSKLITRVSGVKFPGSSGLDEMEKFWGDYVDQVAFVNYNPWENAYEAPKNDIETPCSDLWRRLFVWWDGCANPCDVDFKSTLSVGSIKDTGVSDLWRSKGYEKLREDHLAKKRSAHSPCSQCTVV